MEKFLPRVVCFVFIFCGVCAAIQAPLDTMVSVTPAPMLPANNDDPDFRHAIKNVTVPVGREAILACSVTELGHYKVGWMRAEDQTILTLHTKVVTHNSRISVTHDNQRTWNLHIRQVKEADRGCYMCQINTSVMKKQIGCVDVHVPPDIKDDQTSSDVTVQEGENATLTCKATGHPSPRILWRREDGESLLIKKGASRVDTFGGDTLQLFKLERRQMGAYLCIASNDVPPAVSKRITLNVNFAPVIKVTNQLLGAPLGTDVNLDCFIEAFPNAINYWSKNRGEMLMDGKRYVVDEIKKSYTIHFKLTIRNFSKRDIGTYTCVSTNSMGKAEGTIRLYEIKVPTRPPVITTEPPVITTPTTTTPQPTTSTTTRRPTRAPKIKEIYYLATTFAPPLLAHEAEVLLGRDAKDVTADASRAAAHRVAATCPSLLFALVVVMMLLMSAAAR
ncbi:lachesin-like isoform X2 [Neocloeon triangulifer]|uniref:lachesin-like isoform X2 n=1 Tax=Neocloeon triangulifer TaxID=2078957 RepID=UPI00286F7E8C|nr:lachesin-like isoform X2 [Neocloeon triangulifer]